MDDDVVWFDIDLEEVPAAHLWKPESVEWAMTVDWGRVNDLVRNNLSLYPVDDHETALRNATEAGVGEVDRDGLYSLYREPIYATSFQIAGGGHRITAMRRQGLRWALGQCYVEDVGETVDELHAYLRGCES